MFVQAMQMFLLHYISNANGSVSLQYLFCATLNLVRFCHLTHESIKMVKLSLLVGAFMASTAAAFAPVPQQSASNLALHATAGRSTPSALITSKTDSTGNNLAIKDFLESAQSTGLLTKVAKSGLLSKAAAAGITLSKVEPLIILAAEKGILDEVLILTEAAGPDIVPLLPTVINLAPQALPLLAAGLDIPPVALQGAAVASLGAAFAIVNVVPDDTVIQVAGQTLAVALLGVAAPAASLVGATILGKVKSL